MTREKIKNAKRIVIKIGSSTLTHNTGKLNLKRIETLAKTISDYSNSGKEIILVSSGAVSAGSAKLGMDVPLTKIEEKKAAAAVGQVELMNIYARFFADYGVKTAQVLLTRDVVDDEIRREEAKQTFATLLNMACVPIVNENDPISSDEIKFSGNDILSAYVSNLCNADLLINLTDRDGMYTKNPADFDDAVLIHKVEKITEEIFSYAGGAGTPRGTGGYITKLQAAEMIYENHTPMIIANGRNPEILYDILEGNVAGTIIENI